MDIQKVLDLLRSVYTEQLYDRKATMIIKFCKERKDGFYYDEIPGLCEILETIINDLKEGVVVFINLSVVNVLLARNEGSS